MSFMSKNPISSPKILEPPEVPYPGTRGLFPMDDGWYDIDDEGKVQKIGGSAGAQLSSDWGQNDETAPDYIKNRTHYDAKLLIGEVTSDTGNMDLSEAFDPTKQYALDIDGEADVIELMPNGDGSISIVSKALNREIMYGFEGASTLTVQIISPAHEYKLYRTEVVALPERFIPATVARTKDVVQKESGKGLSTNDFTTEHKEKLENIKPADWSQNDETQPDFVKNRTHYEIPRIVLAEVHRTAEETTMENGFDGICDVHIDKSLVEVGKEYKYTINGQSGTFIFSDEYMEFGGASGSVYDSGNEYDWQTYWGYGSVIDIILYDGGEIRQLDEKYIPDSVARTAEIGDINVALEEIIELQEELMTPDGDEVSY